MIIFPEFLFSNYLRFIQHSFHCSCCARNENLVSRDLDGRLFIASIISEITERLKNSTSKQIITWLSRHSNLRLEIEEYAELIQHLE